MDTKTINECKELSLAGKITFPEVVVKLLEGGVERYTVDLVRFESIYYSKNDEVHCTQFQLEGVEGIDLDFSEGKVREAIKAIQGGEIEYVEFLHRIMQAGVVYYSAFLEGKRVHYVGRRGEIWIEYFPKKTE